MARSYSNEDVVVWQDGETIINATNLNKINQKTANAISQLYEVLDEQLNGLNLKVVEEESEATETDTIYFVLEGE